MNRIPAHILFVTLVICHACTNTPATNNQPGKENDSIAVPQKAVPPKIPDRVSEKEAYLNYIDTLSSPAGLSILVNDPDDQSTYTFCNDTLVVLQYSPSEWMLGTWLMEGNQIRIHFFKAAGQRGIGDPVVQPGNIKEKPVYAEYVPYVYYTDDDKSLPWEEMKAIMMTGGRSLYVLEEKKASCNLSKINIELPGKYGYISSRLIESSELSHVDEAELTIMIQEIYARYGLIFKDRKLKEYFKKQTWYKPRYTDVSKYIQGIEEKNLFLLLKKNSEIQKMKPKKKLQVIKKKKSLPAGPPVKKKK